MSYDTSLYSRKGRIGTITLNRPEKFNTIRPPMPAEIESALAEANADGEVRVIVLQGAGEAFCAGFDFSGGLEHFAGWGGQPDGRAWDPGRGLRPSASAPASNALANSFQPRNLRQEVQGCGLLRERRQGISK